mgnify:CR=1 FL=1
MTIKLFGKIGMNNYVIGLDLGGTNIRVAAVTREGEILHKVKKPTDAVHGKERVISNILQVINTIRRKPKDFNLLAVGMGIPGIIFFDIGIFIKFQFEIVDEGN